MLSNPHRDFSTPKLMLPVRSLIAAENFVQQEHLKISNNAAQGKMYDTRSTRANVIWRSKASAK